MTQLAPAPSPPTEVAPEPALRRPTRTVRFQHVRALLVLNALYFGVAALAAGYAFLNPAVQAELTRAAIDAFSPSGGLGALVQAYLNGALLAAIVMTFLVNLMFGSLIFLTLPSAVIPFAGILLGVYRAILWGLLFAPTESNILGPTLLLHMPTILIEGEAYIVAMLGVWLWWHAVFSRPGARWSAWRQGLVLQTRVYAAVAVLLAIAAVYEAIEVIWILPAVAPL
jgi:hypothetical protein